jgi:hypothetical protein
MKLKVLGGVAVLAVAMSMFAPLAAADTVFGSGYYFVGNSGGDPQCAARNSSWSSHVGDYPLVIVTVTATAVAYHGANCTVGLPLPARWIEARVWVQFFDIATGQWYNEDDGVDSFNSNGTDYAQSIQHDPVFSGQCLRAVTLVNVAVAGGWHGHWDISNPDCQYSPINPFTQT